MAVESGKADRSAITIALSGDVMTGRGIDQALPRPCEPHLHEGYAASARDYVALAERVNGKIPFPVDLAYVWGDAPAARERLRADAWIVNLETAVTRSEDYAPKGINYRMSPENAACLSAAGIDCCTLANNHVLDWGTAGLLDTLETLPALQLKIAGAGRNATAAAAPAILELEAGRVLVFAFGSPSSGIPPEWAATAERPGVNLIAESAEQSVDRIAADVSARRRPGDIVVASIHWGGNWGYAIPSWQRRLAHRLVDTAGVDTVFGHSSHHPKAIEIHRGKPILYGAGDFLNDYEGIGGYEAYRGDLSLLYGLNFEAETGELTALRMAPFRIRRFSLENASPEAADWLSAVLGRESGPFGVSIKRDAEGFIAACPS
jgi:poly-gamma-glutamate synthesis protein (capsule biosynthesis protein)